MKTRSSKKLKLTDIMEKWRKRKKGHFAVYTREGRRFVLPLDYLNHPIFQVLLEMAEEEFGNTACGPLQVPCEEEFMDYIILLMRSRNGMEKAFVSMSTWKGGASVSSFLPLFRGNSHDQSRLQSLVS